LQLRKQKRIRNIDVARILSGVHFFSRRPQKTF